MAPPNNPNIARVTVQYTRDTRQFENVFHLYRSSGWGYANLIAALTAAKNLWSTYFIPCIPGTITLTNFHGVVYDPDGAPWVADVPVTTGNVGTRPGVSEAGNVTMAISERAQYAGPAYRGRIYLPALSESDVSTLDNVGSGLIGVLATFAFQWLSVFADATANGKLTIFHRNDNLHSPVATIILENIVDSQRRRLPGRGR